ncbi:hypothetical protein H0H87_002767 [Tephrocybe sp. NHM501043]|nr:hypothetical protein H0H87_002767 [Tephrocybe sp. NHM501043]
MTTAAESTNAGKWSSYGLSIYIGRKGPEPLGTVVFEEIEEKAREKLKDYPGKRWIFHGDAELASASAAGKLGIPFILSTAATRSIEEVAAANGNGHRWFQLYWFVHS